MEKICPLMSKLADCQKENCAWWVKEISSNPARGPVELIRREGCAILLLGLGVWLKP